MVLTKEQRKSLKRIYDRDQNSNNPECTSYRAFRRTVQYASYDSYIMVNWAGMWLGIEKDGYTHS